MKWEFYFLKIKYTAKIRKTNPMRWLVLNDSFLKTTKVNNEKTTSVTTSCITFSCQIEKGPPFPSNPILLAGTIAMYSKRAIIQLNKITLIKPRSANHENSFNLRCPYQAKVIKTLDTMSNPMV